MLAPVARLGAAEALLNESPGAGTHQPSGSRRLRSAPGPWVAFKTSSLIRLCNYSILLLL